MEQAVTALEIAVIQQYVWASIKVAVYKIQGLDITESEKEMEVAEKSMNDLADRR